MWFLIFRFLLKLALQGRLDVFFNYTQYFENEVNLPLKQKVKPYPLYAYFVLISNVFYTDVGYRRCSGRNHRGGLCLVLRNMARVWPQWNNVYVLWLLIRNAGCSGTSISGTIVWHPPYEFFKDNICKDESMIINVGNTF